MKNSPLCSKRHMSNKSLCLVHQRTNSFLKHTNVSTDTETYICSIRKHRNVEMSTLRQRSSTGLFLYIHAMGPHRSKMGLFALFRVSVCVVLILRSLTVTGGAKTYVICSDSRSQSSRCTGSPRWRQYRAART